MCESKVMKMNKKEKLDNMLCEKNGVLQTADVIEAGISKTYFMEYAKKMELECVAKGIYLSQDASFLFITNEISTDYFFS